jgi:serine/threonine protein phosphatase PrpC
MKLRIGVRTDVGRSRSRNEDAYLIDEPVFAVADGMGGHRGGDVASSLALESLQAPDEGTSGEDFQRLVAQIKEANQRVLERGEADRDLRGMGTTLTVILAADGKAHVAHVGDSRAYMLRDEKLQQLTEDHTLVQRMVREGRLTEEEAHTHPQRSIVTRALGVDENIPIDELTLDLKEGDRLLLCTDGLSSMLGRDAIQQILLAEPDPQKAADRLVEEANQAGGDDNITVVVLDVAPDGDNSAERAAAAGASSGATAVVAPARSGASPRTTAPEPRLKAAPEPAGHVRRPRPRIRWGRLAVWGGVVVLIVVAGLVGSRLYIDRQWYVGDDGGRVAIYNGIPTTVLGFKLSHVQETTELSATDAERLAYWRDLKDGITAGSFEEAQSIVDRIRQDLMGEGIPPPGGSR